MQIRKKLIFDRDYSDTLGAWMRYDTLLKQLDAGLITLAEAGKLAGY